MNTSPIEIQMKKIYRSMLFDKNLGGENIFNRRRSEDKDGGGHGGHSSHSGHSGHSDHSSHSGHSGGPRMTATADFTDKGGPRVTATFAAGYTSPSFNANRRHSPSPPNSSSADKPKESKPKFTTIFDIRSSPARPQPQDRVDIYNFDSWCCFFNGCFFVHVCYIPANSVST
jgi:hypothetical protein